MMDVLAPPAVKKPSGSEMRRRSSPLPFRVSPEERAQIEAAADRAGLSISSYVRAQTLAKPVTRARRVPPVNRAALAQLLGHINRVGGNVNQIARQLNMGREADEIPDLAATLKAVREMRDAVLLALGMQPGSGQGAAEPQG